MIADDIGQPRITACKYEDFPQGIWRKNRVLRAGHLQTVQNVLGGFFNTQWFDLITNGDALAYGTVAGLQQDLVEFRLTHKENIDEFAIFHLDIRQQSNFLE